MSDTAPILLLPRDLTLTIYRHLQLERTNTGWPKAWLSLALTCSFLSESALDLLWNMLPSLWPLFCTLPADLCERISTVDADRKSWSIIKPIEQFRLLREPKKEDFTRLRTYARRIVRIDPRKNYALAGAKIWGADVVWDMLRRHGPKPLLPNIVYLAHVEDLKMFDDCPSKFSDIQYLRADLLFGPKLEKAELCLTAHRQTSTDRSRDLAETLPVISSRLKELHFYPYGSSATIRGVQFRELSHLTHVTADCVKVAADALLGLGSLPHLRNLTILLEETVYEWHIVPPEAQIGLFPSLIQLRLIVEFNDFPEICYSFLKTVSSSTLEEVSIRAHRASLGRSPQENSSIVFVELCHTLASFITLRKLDLSVPSLLPLHTPDTFHGFSALSALHNLQELSIQSGTRSGMLVDDILLVEVASACPRLRSLRLRGTPHVKSHKPLSCDSEEKDEEEGHTAPERRAPETPSATVAGLISLARGCPELDELEVPIDFRVAPVLDTPEVPPVLLVGSRMCQVTRLWVGGSVPAESVKMASFLSLVFPFLEEIKSDSMQLLWDEVYQNYEWFLAVRAQERQWADAGGRSFKVPLDTSECSRQYNER
ncbi:hypothetical protein C8Q79DRAFT_301918 [Trametes meyenii]|nr:hypothetical protein C8Q79DRAFT_301918 [Trametes meyenii]